ncbi:uncharacterized protein LOC124149338 isoform X2 [Haliotis rufescens]|uniref:uncharacterized protein LOC124149338 isoform X2 n=1 Tax=Haliotis rufescens TaxID=6454 RepID=UPI00201E8BB0|nr:uncharacterized protein LOC124149338 isoform X2 [Haliotis rufescens]
MKLFIFLIAVAFASGSPVRVIDRTADELKCGICQHLTQDLHTVLSKEDTQTKVVSGLMSRCESLVEGQNERCRDIVHGIAPSMLSLLVDNVHPYVMCSTLEMCPVEHVEHEETQVEHVSKTTLCEFCQFAINIVERYVQKNASIPKINETLYNFCNDLPDPLKSECLQFAPAVVKALAEGVDPHQACVKAHVCPSETQEHPLTWNAVTCDVCNNVAEKMFHEDAGAVCMDLKICLRPTLPAVQREVRQEPQQEVGAGPGCELCEFLVNTIDQYLKQNKSETAINATVTKICNDLPEPLKDTCNSFAPQLVKVLAQGFDPEQACTKIGLCGSQHEPELEPERDEEDEPELEPEREEEHEHVPEPEREEDREHVEPVEAGPGCELCQFLINTIDEYLKENKTEAAINATVTNFCNELPEPLKDTCTGFAPQLVKLLAEGVDPKQACTKIGLCSSSEEEHIEEHVEHEEHHEEQNVAAGPGCELCQFLINTIDQYLKENKTEAAINATVTNFCNELPEPLKDTCTGFAPQLVKMLAEGVDPKQACTKIGLCSSSEEEHIEEHVEHEEHHEEQNVAAGPGCELCQFLINTIDQYLKENKTEAAINATVTNFCNELPEPLKDTCTGFAPQLVKMLAEGVDPKQACTKIGLCSSSEEEHIEEHVEHEEHHEEQNVAAGPGCELCQFLINTIDQYLKENKTEAAINATVTNFCNELPEPLKDTCTGFAPQLVKLLAEGVDPKQACTKIGLCSSSEEEHIEEHVEHEENHEEQNVAAGPGCELCQFLINTIDQYLKENKTEAAINATVTNFCNELPEPLKDTCTGFAPQLVKLLAEGVDPKQACTKIGLCSSAEPEHREEHPQEHPQEHQGEHREAAGPGCELCQFLINTIDQYLKENKTEAAINATVTHFCNELPEPLKDTCTGFAPQLVKLLAEGVDPKQACTKIGLCSSYDQTPQIDDAKANATEAAINTTILRLCQGLPEPLKTTCFQFAPEVVKALSQGVDPNMTCTKIKLCSGSEAPVFQFVTCEVCRASMEKLYPEEFKKICRVACSEESEAEQIAESFAQKVKVAIKEPDSALTCELCTLLVNTLDTYLKNNHSSAAINSTLQKICKSLPAALQIECKVLTPLLVKELAKGFNATVACTNIKACSKNTGEILSRIARSLTEEMNNVGGVKCSLCKDLIGVIDLDINGDKAKTKKQFEDVCHRLPPPTDQKCLDFVVPNFPKIWKEIVDGKLAPEKVCQTIKLC